MRKVYSIGLKREFWSTWEEYGIENAFGELDEEHMKHYHGCETIEEWLEANPRFELSDDDAFDEFYAIYEPY